MAAAAKDSSSIVVAWCAGCDKSLGEADRWLTGRRFRCPDGGLGDDFHVAAIVQRDAMYQGRRRRGGFLVISVLSKGDDRLDQELRAFASSKDCEFVAAGTTDAGYHHHGDFVVPLKYSAKRNDVDFQALGGSLLKVRQHLRTVQSHGLISPTDLLTSRCT